MSRQQIGGVVGAIVGGVAGAYGSFGFGAGAGAQYGYVIGPALGELQAFDLDGMPLEGASEAERSEVKA